MYEAKLAKKYKEATVKLKDQLGLKNMMQVPKITKIMVSSGQGIAVQQMKYLESALSDLESITGQKPVMTRAKKSIAGFKLREGMPIGASVTLRGNRMYEFLDRFINIVAPRVRDFRGYSARAFDGRGNYSLGIKEQIVFPEIDYDKVDKVRGLGITVVTSSENDHQARALLDLFNFPFRK